MHFPFTSSDIKRSNLLSHVQRHSLQSSVFSIPDKPEKELLRRSVSACSLCSTKRERSNCILYGTQLISKFSNSPSSSNLMHSASSLHSRRLLHRTLKWAKASLCSKVIVSQQKMILPVHMLLLLTYKRLTGCRKALLMLLTKSNNSCTVCLFFKHFVATLSNIPQPIYLC